MRTRSIALIFFLGIALYGHAADESGYDLRESRLRQAWITAATLGASPSAYQQILSASRDLITEIDKKTEALSREVNANHQANPAQTLELQDLNARTQRIQTQFIDPIDGEAALQKKLDQCQYPGSEQTIQQINQSYAKLHQQETCTGHFSPDSDGAIQTQFSILNHSLNVSMNAQEKASAEESFRKRLITAARRQVALSRAKGDLLLAGASGAPSSAEEMTLGWMKRDYPPAHSRGPEPPWRQGLKDLDGDPEILRSINQEIHSAQVLEKARTDLNGKLRELNTRYEAKVKAQRNFESIRNELVNGEFAGDNADPQGLVFRQLLYSRYHLWHPSWGPPPARPMNLKLANPDANPLWTGIREELYREGVIRPTGPDQWQATDFQLDLGTLKHAVSVGALNSNVPQESRVGADSAKQDANQASSAVANYTYALPTDPVQHEHWLETGETQGEVTEDRMREHLRDFDTVASGQLAALSQLEHQSDAEDTIDTLMTTQPATAAQIMRDSPEFAALLCDSVGRMQQREISRENWEKWTHRATFVAMGILLLVPGADLLEAPLAASVLMATGSGLTVATGATDLVHQMGMASEISRTLEATRLSLITQNQGSVAEINQLSQQLSDTMTAEVMDGVMTVGGAVGLAGSVKSINELRLLADKSTLQEAIADSVKNSPPGKYLGKYASEVSDSKLRIIRIPAAATDATEVASAAGSTADVATSAGGAGAKAVAKKVVAGVFQWGDLGQWPVNFADRYLTSIGRPGNFTLPVRVASSALMHPLVLKPLVYDHFGNPYSYLAGRGKDALQWAATPIHDYTLENSYGYDLDHDPRLAGIRNQAGTSRVQKLEDANSYFRELDSYAHESRVRFLDKPSHQEMSRELGLIQTKYGSLFQSIAQDIAKPGLTFRTQYEIVRLYDRKLGQQEALRQALDPGASASNLAKLRQSLNPSGELPASLSSAFDDYSAGKISIGDLSLKIESWVDSQYQSQKDEAIRRND